MLKSFLENEEGQSVAEYSLLLTLIGATLVLMMTMTGLSISQALGIKVTWKSYYQWAYETFNTKLPG